MTAWTGSCSTSGLPNVSTLSMRKGMQINYSWLMYVFGHTAKRMLAAGDVLTGFMSGCERRAVRRPRGHGRVEPAGQYAGQIRVRRLHAAGHDRLLPGRGLGPRRDRTQDDEVQEGGDSPHPGPGDDRRRVLLALFFELREGPGLWCVGGTKRIPPMNRAALAAHLRT